MYGYNHEAKCLHCGEKFTSSRWGSRYCSNAHRQAAYRLRLDKLKKAKAKAAKAALHKLPGKKRNAKKTRRPNAKATKAATLKADLATARKTRDALVSTARRAVRKPPGPTAAPADLCTLHPKPKKSKRARATRKTSAKPGRKRR